MRIVKGEGSTKEMILRTAEQMFVTKGFARTTISDIASAVGISESTVYEHYRNKEDILFTIPKEGTEGLLQNNEQHLRGLAGAGVKLRKLIWNYLEFLARNESYASLLLFELRPNRAFYRAEAFEQVCRLAQAFQDVVVEGQKNGEFRRALFPWLVLNMIFGTVDHILITWLTRGNPGSPLECFEPLVDLVFHAVSGERAEPVQEDKRKRILSAAAAIFSQIGYSKARIQDIARLAGVADGTIYQYFRNKEEILFTLPIENTKALIAIQEEHLNGIKDTDLRLSALITDYLQYLDSHKDYSSIVLFDLRYNRSFYATEGYELFRRFARRFYDAITSGQRQGDYRPGLDAYLAVKMVFGLIDQALASWILFETPKEMVSLCGPVCELVLAALRE